MTVKIPKSVAKIPVPLYGGSVWLAQSLADTVFCATVLGGDTDISGCGGASYPAMMYRGNAVYLVGLIWTTPDILVHELSHAAFNILGRAGVEIDPDNNEAFCYLLQHLVESAPPPEGSSWLRHNRSTMPAASS